MKTLTILLGYFALCIIASAILFSSFDCTDNSEPVTVQKIEILEGNYYAMYYISHDASEVNTSIKDTIGKWNIGDTIRFN